MANYNWKTSGDHTIFYACWTYTLPCRWPFWLNKRIYRQSDTDTLSQMAEVVQWSSTNNIAQLYSWECWKWDSFCQKMFNRIPLITKYQYFRFSSSTPGIVYVRTSCSAEEKPIKIFKKKVTAATVKRARLPPLIPPAGLTDERRKYLYEQIRPFVSPQYQDVTCPPLWFIIQKKTFISYMVFVPTYVYTFCVCLKDTLLWHFM